jgi:hypothetical protein
MQKEPEKAESPPSGPNIGDSHDERGGDNGAVPSVFDVQKALHKKMLKYPGGIEGVWDAIDSRFKFPENSEMEGIKGIKNIDKIKKSAFRRQVSRLRTHPGREKITFSLNGSILLLMNIFDILDIRSLSDLLDTNFQKTDINAVTMVTYRNTKKIRKKLNTLSDTLALALKRPQRFTAIKVCHDWEIILSRLHEIISIDNDPYVSNFDNDQNSTIYNYFIRGYISNFPKDYHFLLWTFNLLNDYKEYFSQDMLLHKYCESVLARQSINYTQDYNFLILCPLYILYFFLKINNRFLSIINDDDKKQEASTFHLTGLSSENNTTLGNDLKSILGDVPVDKFIFSKNNEMYKSLKKILILINQNKMRLPYEKYKEYYDLMKEIFDVFIDLYFSHTGIDSSNLNRLFKEIKNLKDLYSKIAFGRYNIFVLGKEHLDTISEKTMEIQSLLVSLERDIEQLPN